MSSNQDAKANVVTWKHRRYLSYTPTNFPEVVVLAVGGGSDPLAALAFAKHLKTANPICRVSICLVAYDGDLKHVPADAVKKLVPVSDGVNMVLLGGKHVPLTDKPDQKANPLVFDLSIPRSEEQPVYLMPIPDKAKALTMDGKRMPELARTVVTAFPTASAVFSIEQGGDSILSRVVVTGGSAGSAAAPSIEDDKQQNVKKGVGVDGALGRDTRVVNGLLPLLPHARRAQSSEALPPLAVMHVVIGPGCDGESSMEQMDAAIHKAMADGSYFGHCRIPAAYIAASKELASKLPPNRTPQIVLEAYKQPKNTPINIDRTIGAVTLKQTIDSDRLSCMIMFKLPNEDYHRDLVAYARLQMGAWLNTAAGKSFVTTDAQGNSVVSDLVINPATGRPADMSRILEAIVFGKMPAPYKIRHLDDTGKQVDEKDAFVTVLENRPDIEAAWNSEDEKWASTAAMGPHHPNQCPNHFFIVPSKAMFKKHPLFSINAACMPATPESKALLKKMVAAGNAFFVEQFGAKAVAETFVHMWGQSPGEGASQRMLHIHYLNVTNPDELGPSYRVNHFKNVPVHHVVTA